MLGTVLPLRRRILPLAVLCTTLVAAFQQRTHGSTRFVPRSTFSQPRHAGPSSSSSSSLDSVIPSWLSSSSSFTKQEEENVSKQRRALIGGFLIAGITSPVELYSYYSHRQNIEPSSTAVDEQTPKTSSFQSLKTVDEALETVIQHGDKRFLHAVVATDYQGAMYHGGNQLGMTTSLSSGTSALNDDNDISLFGIDPSQWGVTDWKQAQRLWGKDNVVAVWPLTGQDNKSHYAWSETKDGIVLDDSMNDKSSSLLFSSLIVDGVDCGRVSLEDALEGNKQVFLQSDRFLMIPQSMYAPLLQKVRDQFLV